MLKAQQESWSSCELVLVPEDMLQEPDMKDFFHAYCVKGESYRSEPIFRKGDGKPWLHLNQVVHEFWMDPYPLDLPELTKSQKRRLTKLIEEFSVCIGDANTCNRQRQSNIKAQIP